MIFSRHHQTTQASFHTTALDKFCLRQLYERKPLNVSNITFSADGREVMSDIVELQQVLCCLVGTYFCWKLISSQFKNNTVIYVVFVIRNRWK